MFRGAVVASQFHSDSATAAANCEALHLRVRDRLLPTPGAANVRPA